MVGRSVWWKLRAPNWMQRNESRWPAASSVEDSSHRFLFLRLLLGLMLGLCINFSSQVEMNSFESFDEWKPELVNAGRAVRMERLTIEEDIVEQYAATDRKAVLKRRRSASRVQFWIAIWKKKSTGKFTGLYWIQNKIEKLYWMNGD